jgi:membrane protein
MLSTMGWGARLGRLSGVARRIYPVDIVWRAVEDYAAHGGGTQAAAVSYYALLSVFPLLLVVVVVFGLVARDPDVQQQVVKLIVDQIPRAINIQNDIESVVAGLANSETTLLGVIGLIAAAWTASGMFTALRKALDMAFDVPDAVSFFHGKALDLLSIIVVMLLVALSLATTTALGILRADLNEHFDSMFLNVGWALTYLLLPLVFSFITFLVAYRMLPSRTARFSVLWIGALLAAIGFEAAKFGFSLYLFYFSHYQKVYGALGGVAAFLFFIYIVATIVIFCAEITSEISKDRARRRRS